MKDVILMDGLTTLVPKKTFFYLGLILRMHEYLLIVAKIQFYLE